MLFRQSPRQTGRSVDLPIFSQTRNLLLRVLLVGWDARKFAFPEVSFVAGSFLREVFFFPLCFGRSQPADSGKGVVPKVRQRCLCRCVVSHTILQGQVADGWLHERGARHGALGRVPSPCRLSVGHACHGDLDVLVVRTRDHLRCAPPVEPSVVSGNVGLFCFHFALTRHFIRPAIRFGSS